MESRAMGSEHIRYCGWRTGPIVRELELQHIALMDFPIQLYFIEEIDIHI